MTSSKSRYHVTTSYHILLILKCNTVDWQIPAVSPLDITRIMIRNANYFVPYSLLMIYIVFVLWVVIYLYDFFDYYVYLCSLTMISRPPLERECLVRWRVRCRRPTISCDRSSFCSRPSYTFSVCKPGDWRRTTVQSVMWITTSDRLHIPHRSRRFKAACTLARGEWRAATCVH